MSNVSNVHGVLSPLSPSNVVNRQFFYVILQTNIEEAEGAEGAEGWGGGEGRILYQSAVFTKKKTMKPAAKKFRAKVFEI